MDWKRKKKIKNTLFYSVFALIVFLSVISIASKNSESEAKKESPVTKESTEIDLLRAENQSLKDKNRELIISRGKTVYLTFDDGPSENTKIILDLLKERNIKATFFPNGTDTPSARKLYARIVKEGHALGNHTYTHDYKNIYASKKQFVEDFERLQDLLTEATGVTPSIYRFPGGSNNQVHLSYGPATLMEEIIEDFDKKGRVYFDWNVDSTDANRATQEVDKIVQSVLSTVQKDRNNVILFHDSATKTSTAAALPVIVDQLLEEGYYFETLSPDSFRVQFFTP